MTIGKVKHVKMSEFYCKGKKMKCSECLYGNRNNCPAGITKYCGEYLGWLNNWKYEFIGKIREMKMLHDKTLFFEIIDDVSYFDVDEDENGDDARWYVYCDVCGYIPYTAKAFDECMSKEHFVSCNYYYTEVEIWKMKEDKEYSDMLENDLY